MGRKVQKLVLIFFLVFVLAISIHNVVNYENYFQLSVFQSLTLLVSIVFAFYFSQRLTDERKTIDIAERLLKVITEDISDTRFCIVNSQEDVDFVRIKIRTVANNIDCLCQLGEKLKIKDEVKYIKNKFDEYEELFGNHVEKLSYLQESSKDFTSKIDCISDKCTYILTGFYKK